MIYLEYIYHRNLSGSRLEKFTFTTRQVQVSQQNVAPNEGPLKILGTMMFEGLRTSLRWAPMMMRGASTSTVLRVMVVIISTWVVMSA